MKICAIICEYNPFHNGHLYQLSLAKNISKADAILCLMSGNFVQRGEVAVLDKHTRAKHAVLAGADVVIELPIPFATSNAELFAKGAISILTAIPNVTTLCFGAEQADKEAFEQAAKLLNDEPKEVSEQIKLLTAQGMSYAKARSEAWKNLIPSEMLSMPNNILGIEYTRALHSAKANIEILPIQRKGGGYSEQALRENFSSASAIRAAIISKTPIGENLPEYVLQDLPQSIDNPLETLEKYALTVRSSKEIAEICDCTEGLENAFKKAATSSAPLCESLTSARYTASRIRRIALQNLLDIPHTFIKECLTNPLYLRILAINKKRLDLLSMLSESKLPLLTRAHDEDVLSNVAKKCFERDIFSEQMYRLLYPNAQQIIHTLFV